MAPFPETCSSVQFVMLLGTVTECTAVVVCCQSVKERSSDELQYTGCGRNSEAF